MTELSRTPQPPPFDEHHTSMILDLLDRGLVVLAMTRDLDEATLDEVLRDLDKSTCGGPQARDYCDTMCAVLLLAAVHGWSVDEVSDSARGPTRHLFLEVGGKVLSEFDPGADTPSAETDP